MSDLQVAVREAYMRGYTDGVLERQADSSKTDDILEQLEGTNGAAR